MSKRERIKNGLQDFRSDDEEERLGQEENPGCVGLDMELNGCNLCL